jgi:hypothetical protein|tara:strand:- start:931 stop:1170 length:240 start_codon:yes stop_codon:yes gene_type:complete
MSGVRKPKDDAEKQRARIAISEGKGTSLADFIEDILGTIPEKEFVEAVKNRIKLAHEQEESIDITALINEMTAMQNQWA